MRVYAYKVVVAGEGMTLEGADRVLARLFVSDPLIGIACKLLNIKEVKESPATLVCRMLEDDLV